MRLGVAGTIRPRAATPPAPPPITKERLEAAAQLRASKSSSNLSVHKAQKKMLRLEYQLYQEQQRREQARGRGRGRGRVKGRVRVRVRVRVYHEQQRREQAHPTPSP